MISLILDTSGSQAFIGLGRDGQLLSQTLLSEPRQLSKFLLPSIESILQGRIPAFIAIGTGPGSFTGTRVGGMIAKTLSFGWKIPLIAFSSTLLPDLSSIAALTYQKFLLGEVSPQIELVYISPTP